MARDDRSEGVTDEHVKIVFDALERFASLDPNFARRHASLLRKRAPSFHALLFEAERERFKPLPPVDSITVAQVTVFDNWQHTNGRRPSRKLKQPNARMDRFRVTIEVWTVDDATKVTERSRAFTGTAALLDGAELKAKLVKLRKPNLIRPFISRGEGDDEGEDWEVYGEVLEGMADDLKGKRIGPLFTKVPNRGTDYHLAQFAVANERALLDRDGSNLKVSIRTPGGDLDFTNFVTSDSKGKPLKGNGVLTSRLARTDRGDLKNWRTC